MDLNVPDELVAKLMSLSRGVTGGAVALLTKFIEKEWNRRRGPRKKKPINLSALECPAGMIYRDTETNRQFQRPAYETGIGRIVPKRKQRRPGPPPNESGYHWVYRSAINPDKWMWRFTVGGTKYYEEGFETAENAARAADRAMMDMYGPSSFSLCSFSRIVTNFRYTDAELADMGYDYFPKKSNNNLQEESTTSVTEIKSENEINAWASAQRIAVATKPSEWTHFALLYADYRRWCRNRLGREASYTMCMFGRVLGSDPSIKRARDTKNRTTYSVYLAIYPLGIPDPAPEDLAAIKLQGAAPSKADLNLGRARNRPKTDDTFHDPKLVRDENGNYPPPIAVSLRDLMNKNKPT